MVCFLPQPNELKRASEETIVVFAASNIFTPQPEKSREISLPTLRRRDETIETPFKQIGKILYCCILTLKMTVSVPHSFRAEVSLTQGKSAHLMPAGIRDFPYSNIQNSKSEAPSAAANDCKECSRLNTDNANEAGTQDTFGSPGWIRDYLLKITTRLKI